MNTIQGLFLRAKHWQIFLFLVVMFGAGEMVTVGVMAANVASTGNAGTLGFLWGSITAVEMLCFVGWLWAMGTFLNSISLPSLRLKTGFFKFSLIYPIVYILPAGPFFLNPDPSLFAIVLPFHFFAVFCLFYDLWFVSKNLALAQTNKPVSFYDYAGPFFLLWFFPIGIWFIQPRVNRLYAIKKNTEPPIQAAAL